MKIMLTKWFSKWSKKRRISDSVLIDGVNSVEEGVSAVNLGGNLFKVRIARQGSGKSGGFRSILVFQKDTKAIFLYGFAKNEQDNISSTELGYFKKLGNDLLLLDDTKLKLAIENGVLRSLED